MAADIDAILFSFDEKNNSFRITSGSLSTIKEVAQLYDAENPAHTQFITLDILSDNKKKGALGNIDRHSLTTIMLSQFRVLILFLKISRCLEKIGKAH